MFPIVSRLMMIGMAAVISFGLIVPIALRRHNTSLAIFIAVLFVAYLVVNVVLWQRMNRRA